MCTSKSKARAACAGLKHLWRRPDILLMIDGPVCCGLVRSVLLYGRKIRSLVVGDAGRLRVVTGIG